MAAWAFGGLHSPESNANKSGTQISLKIATVLPNFTNLKVGQKMIYVKILFLYRIMSDLVVFTSGVN